MISPNDQKGGHAAAIFSIIVWGCTFISSKILLQRFNPIEILFLRFIIGFVMLCLINPRIPRPVSLKTELYFAGAGLFGVTAYYLLENLSLTYTLAANVSVITCAAPFFTAIFAAIFLKEKVLTPFFMIGFVCAISGICLLSLYGSELEVDIIGTLLALGASAYWGVYSILVKKASSSGFSTLALTQRFFFYGIIFMAPFMKAMGFAPDLSYLKDLTYLLNLLFLGMIASALCFLTWNHALARLGTVKASVYIYLVPVITVFASGLILHERITEAGYIGIILTVAGLILSEVRIKPRNRGMHPHETCE